MVGIATSILMIVTIFLVAFVIIIPIVWFIFKRKANKWKKNIPDKILQEVLNEKERSLRERESELRSSITRDKLEAANRRLTGASPSFPRTASFEERRSPMELPAEHIDSDQRASKRNWPSFS